MCGRYDTYLEVIFVFVFLSRIKLVYFGVLGPRVRSKCVVATSRILR